MIMDTTANYRKRGNYLVSDKPGTFMQIEKELLLLDERYQRSQSAVKVAVMASKWSWQACGCILVAHRKVPSAVKFYVFDGGHRVAAAKKLAEITTLPCLVFEAAKDATAKLVLEMVHMAGRKVGKDDVACVRAIGDCLNRDERVFRKIWQCKACST